MADFFEELTFELGQLSRLHHAKPTQDFGATERGWVLVLLEVDPAAHPSLNG
jgi:hypothetical protein